MTERRTTNVRVLLIRIDGRLVYHIDVGFRHYGMGVHVIRIQTVRYVDLRAVSSKLIGMVDVGFVSLVVVLVTVRNRCVLGVVRV